MSSATFELGSSIREVRLRHGLTLPEVGEQLRVPAKVLRALEWERFDLVGDDANARRALRAYVEYLGLDSDAYLAEYEARLGLSPTLSVAVETPAEPSAPVVPSAPVPEAPAPTAPSGAPPPPPVSPATVVVEPQAVPSEPTVPPEPTVLPEPAAPRRRRESTAYLVILLPILAALATTLVLDHFIWSDDGKPRASAGPSPPPAAAAAPTTPAETGEAEPASPPPPAPSTAPVTFVVTASRGDSWLVVRYGSIDGKTLFEGTLEQGSSFTARGPRLWVRLGAATNVDVAVDSVRPPLELYGTLDAIVDADGFRKVPLAQ